MGAGWPSSSSWPEVGFSSRANSRASVDLPEPLSPTIAVIRPAGSASETSVNRVHGTAPAGREVLGDLPGLEQRRTVHGHRRGRGRAAPPSGKPCPRLRRSVIGTGLVALGACPPRPAARRAAPGADGCRSGGASAARRRSAGPGAAPGLRCWPVPPGPRVPRPAASRPPNARCPRQAGQAAGHLRPADIHGVARSGGGTRSPAAGCAGPAASRGCRSATSARRAAAGTSCSSPSVYGCRGAR